MSTSSCPGFLDRDGIWNNGFDCSSPRICCGTEINRYCCVPTAILTSSSSSSSSSSPSPILYDDFDDADPYTMRTSSTLLNDKWLLLQMCTVGIFVAILLLLFVIIYLYFTTLRHGKLKERMSIVQLPLPAVASICKEPVRVGSKRTSTASSCGSSDTKSGCTEASAVFNTPLNLYPASHCRSSTSPSSSASYYMYPNEFEYLCK